jgi:hypothetical protein
MVIYALVVIALMRSYMGGLVALSKSIYRRWISRAHVNAVEP